MKKKVLITCAVVLGVLLAVYLGFAFYFSSHYLFNTKINSVKYAGKTAVPPILDAAFTGGYNAIKLRTAGTTNADTRKKEWRIHP